MKHMRGCTIRASIVVTALAALACSSQPSTLSDGLADAGTPSQPTSQARPLALAEVASKHHAELDRLLRPTDRGFVGDGPTIRATASSPNELGAALAPVATGALDVSLGGSPTSRISLTPVAARPSAGSVHQGRAVFEDVYPSTDRIVVAHPARVEELLVLRDHEAPSEHTWRVDVGSDLPRSQVEPSGAITFSSDDGEPQLRIVAPYLVDAAGTVRSATAKLADGYYHVSFDTAGLAFPVVLDPGVETAIWEDVTPASPPPARTYTPLAYDSANQVTVMFGGYSSSNTYLSDTWEWNGTLWSITCAAGSCGSGTLGARRGHMLAFDSTRSRTVMFGGRDAVSTALDDTWEYNAATNAWAAGCGGAGCSTKPTARQGAGMAFDSQNAVTVLFSGVLAGGSPAPNDTWSYNGTVWAPICNAGACLASSPPARRYPGMAYDAARNVVVLFGGQDAVTNNYRSDTWELSGSTWSKRCDDGACGIPPRTLITMAFDSRSKRVVVFGGADSGASPRSDTWEWNGTVWSDPYPGTTTPPGRSGHGTAYDAARRRVVMFGSDATGKTWTYHSRGGTCTTAADCDTNICVDGVCCTTTCTGVCQRCDGAGTNRGLCTTVTNATDPDTCTGTSSCDAAGACKKAQGQVCSANSECATGNCVDGRCCQTGSCGTCASCANTAGTCTTVVVNQDDDSCNGNNTCNATGVCKKKSGQGCTLATECASNYCVDSTCCANDCTTACRSCANAAGTCTTVVSNQEDGTCTGTSTCDAAGNCKKKQGQGCSAGSECANGNCADSYCCDTACAGGCDVCSAAAGASQNGTCTVLGSGSAGQCGAYKCGGSAACPTTCSSDASCTAGNYCAGNACTPKKGLGEQCTAGSQCALGNCVDGVCCDGTCTGKCMACAAGNKEDASMANNGKCGAAKKGSNPGSQCVASSDPCGDQASCSGTPGECAKGAAGTSCGPTTCSNGAVSGKICNGAGACVDQTNAQCAPYVCKGAACSSPCTADTDCVTTPQPHYCSNGVCIPKIDNGKTCTAAASCKSGFCIDQVCCDAPCNGQCEACAETGTLGQCTPVTGKPRGTRTDCAGTAGDKCKGTCDGANKSACAYPAAGTACKDAACTGDVSQPAGTCDGAGLCSQLSTKNCLPYGCNAASGVCNTTCASDTECAQGAKCDTNTGKCAVTSATCKDATTVLLPNGQSESCVPYKCVGGACQQQCSTTTDCADGYICQGSSCVAAEGGTDSGVGGGSGAGGSSSGGSSTGGSSTGGAGGTAGKKSDSGGDEGGCGCRVPSKGAGSSAYWLAALGLAVLRRRRRNGQTVSERAGAER